MHRGKARDKSSKTAYYLAYAQIETKLLVDHCASNHLAAIMQRFC